MYLHFKICSTVFVSSVIASDWKPTMVFYVTKLVRENDSFLHESWEKVGENEFCRVVGTMFIVHFAQVYNVHT